MKTIGILLRDYKNKADIELTAFKTDLLKYLHQYNINIICIPILFECNPYDEFERVIEAIKLCDGIVLPGGAENYEIDLKIAKYLYDQNIPTLGLCLGMQIMALTFDGDIEKLKTKKHQSTKEYVHTVKINTNSKLYSILKSKTIQVNSRHSDYITTTDLFINAISEEPIIEGIEDKKEKILYWCTMASRKFVKRFLFEKII